MREQLCAVQFIHPGGEHGPDADGVKHWNSGPHKRKFLRLPGTIGESDGSLREDDVIFWGEWEAESKVATEFQSPVPEGPKYLFEPFYSDPGPTGWRQNTDPFVFGDRFHYTGCLQHTRRGPTQLRFLAHGSLILFGSSIGRRKFVLDTLLVVGDHVDHGPRDFRDALAGRVAETYWAVTLEPWYSGSMPGGRSYRLYSGASHEEPWNGMFSFFPASTEGRHPGGFARPEIYLPGLITSNLTQGKRLNPQRDVGMVKRIWDEIVDQVRAAGLGLGVRARLPQSVPGYAVAREAMSEGGCNSRSLDRDDSDQQERQPRC